MKKLGIVAIALLIGTGMAFATSYGIPWFMDNAPEANKVPGVNPGVMTLITLKSNVGETLECAIQYYNQEGVEQAAIHPDPAIDQNTFLIAPFSALQFRPVAVDPSAVTTDPRTGALGQAGGQEGAQGVLVPDRDTSDGKKNGSCAITYVGAPEDMTGQVLFIQTAADGRVLSYAHAL